jgi:BolA protein
VPDAEALAAERRSRIEHAFREAFAPLHLDVLDEGHRHRGHAGAAGGGGHFRVTIVSQVFAGHSRVERHRMLYAALGDAVGTDIHALALHAWTPEEYREREG